MPTTQVMTTPSVGIAVLTFNHARFVREAIDSILDEGHPPERLQIVVVDNGSTDDTPQILQEYADRVELHCIDPIPVNSAFNYGLARLSADFFTVFAGDDVWLPGRIERSLAVLERRPEVGLVYGDKLVIDADGRRLSDSFVRDTGLRLPDGPPLGPLLDQN